MLQTILFITSFECIGLVLILILWNASGYIGTVRYLLPFSLLIGTGSLTLFYYLQGIYELAKLVGVFFVLTIIFVLYVTFSKNVNKTYTMDIPANSYAVYQDSTSSRVYSQLMYRLVYNDVIYTTSFPIIGTPALRLQVTEDAANNVRYAQVIVKEKLCRSPRRLIHIVALVTYTVLCILGPFICLYFDNNDKTAKFVIFMIFGAGAIMFDGAKGKILIAQIFYVIIAVCMLIAVFLY